MGERIKRLRLEKGMTLQEVGDAVGVGKSTVRKWETGMIANMKRDKIAKLAKVLGVDVAYLMGWAEAPVEIVTYEIKSSKNLLVAEVKTPYEDSDFREIAEMYSQMDEKQKSRILEYVKLIRNLKEGGS